MGDGPTSETEIPTDIQTHDELEQIWIEKRNFLLNQLINELKTSKEEASQHLNINASASSNFFRKLIHRQAHRGCEQVFQPWRLNVHVVGRWSGNKLTTEIMTEIIDKTYAFIISVINDEIRQLEVKHETEAQPRRLIPNRGGGRWLEAKDPVTYYSTGYYSYRRNILIEGLCSISVSFERCLNLIDKRIREDLTQLNIES